MASNQAIVDEDLKLLINEQLSNSLPSGNDYKNVRVLLIYWEEIGVSKHPNFHDEAADLELLFKDAFNYNVTHFEIPLDQSQVALEAAILSFILEKDQNTLLIFHYGGHGDPDDRAGEHRKQSVWASATCGGPTIEWFKIQPRLKSARSDVLLIIDSCFSAQAARDNHQISSRFELLAACPMNQMTPPPGPDSFTTAFIKTVKALLPLQGHVTISQIHNSLSKASSSLFESCIYFELQQGSGKGIVLQPLLQKSKQRSGIASTLELRLSTSARIDNEEAYNDILVWLTRYAPRIVTELSVEKICHTSRSLLDFVHEEAGGRTVQPLFLQLTTDAQQDALSICEELQTFLSKDSVISRLIIASSSPTSTIRDEIARRFVSELIRKVSNLQTSIELNIISTFDDKASLQRAISNASIRDIGIHQTLKMREISLDREADEMALTEGPMSSEPQEVLGEGKVLLGVRHIPNSDPVFIEYKYYQKSERNSSTYQTVENLVAKLFKVLQQSKPEDFHSMTCKEWKAEPEFDRFALVFEIPSPQFQFYKSLQEVMTNSNPRLRPTMEQRLTIASKIGEAVRKWHLAGWVHQEISSRNIIFWGRDAKHMDFDRPFLCGFEFCRPSAHPSYPRYVENLAFDIYRHPDRQGAPSIRHHKVHDLYSFGILLLEIGLWQLAADILGGRSNVSSQTIKDTLCQNAEIRLRHYMGASYANAVVTCINGDFGVVEDNLAETRLSKSFDNLVLRRIARGILPN